MLTREKKLPCAGSQFFKICLGSAFVMAVLSERIVWIFHYSVLMDALAGQVKLVYIR
jgi:hypothetical protein